MALTEVVGGRSRAACIQKAWSHWPSWTSP